MKRIGLLGGSFNPIHLGHLHLAESVRNELDLDKIIFIPTGLNPFKSKKKEISDFERLEMVKIAVQNNPFFEISEIEINQEGKSYTIDTIQNLSELYPNSELYFITGADIMFEITRWKEADKLLQSVVFVTCCRPGYSQKKLDKRIVELKEQYNAKIIKLVPSQMDIASSHIRNSIAQGYSVKYLIPDEIEQYIIERNLYTDKYDESRLVEEKIIRKLKQILKPSRFEHTMHVAECAEKLAQKYGCDEKKARLAGLLHDCAKNYSDDELIEVACASNLDVDEIILSEPQLLHGPVGAIIANQEYNVEDQTILDAIHYHTTGRPHMTTLEKIIYLADFIEPGRKYPGVERLRIAVNEDLDRAMIIALTNTIRYITSINGLIHSKTIEARNHYILKINKEKDK